MNGPFPPEDPEPVRADRVSRGRRPLLSRRSFIGLILASGAATVAAILRNVAGHRAPAPSPRSHVSFPRRPATTTEPPPTPAESPSPATPKGSLLIHGTGDVNLDPDYVTTYRTRGYGYAWSGIGGLFERDDLAIVNCECPVSRRGTKYPGKQFIFRGDPAALPAMKAAGVDVASMANNHSYDYGPEALLDTRRNMLSAGIAPVGAGRDPDEATLPAMLHAKGWRVAVLGLDQVLDPDPEEKADDGHPGTAGGHDFAAMVAAVRAAKAGADLLAVIIHWGVELDTHPRMQQVTQGHALIEAGADVIFGSHAHRLQPMEMYRGRPIFYSLGNFVWPNFSVAGSTTAVAEVRVSPEGRFAARMLPAFIEAPGHPVLRGH